MRIEIACFTARGLALAERLRDGLAARGQAAAATRCGAGGDSVRRWTAERFAGSDALVFVGAAGIAVRAVAPHLASKTSDPAVAVVDEAGRFVVSLLSGHIGGGNVLAETLAALLGATPVITTATDVNGVFAVDAWAVECGYRIIDPGRIKTVSARLLAGETVGVRSAFAVEGAVPAGLELVAVGGEVVVDARADDDHRALHVVPPVAALGVGCRRGTPERVIAGAFAAFCAAAGIFPEAVGKVCSIDLKRDEPGLVAFCRKIGAPFATYAAAELAALPGAFSSSEFVLATAGVDTVCERAAVAGSGGELLVRKTIVDGVAFAAALARHVVRFAPPPS